MKRTRKQPSHSLPRILLLYTGGTIGMDLQKGRNLTPRLELPKINAKDLKKKFLQRVPELKEFSHYEIKVLCNEDSANMGPTHWIRLARVISRSWNQFDGFVILHGTDTLAYTANALSFLLEPCRKPVILTGAQRPLSALRTDARRNLISAVEIAAQGPRPELNRVSVFFDHCLFSGESIQKQSAAQFDAFSSPHDPILAEVGTEIEYNQEAFSRARKHSLFGLKPFFSRNVVVLQVTPGFPAHAIRTRLLPECEAMILVIFASGTAPTSDPEVVALAKDAKTKGIPLLLVTEGAGAISRPGQYAAGRALLAEGAIWAGDVTREHCFVKTSIILGQAGGQKQFMKLWEKME